jgi:hypothetical protein
MLCESRQRQKKGIAQNEPGTIAMKGKFYIVNNISRRNFLFVFLRLITKLFLGIGGFQDGGRLGGGKSEIIIATI